MSIQFEELPGWGFEVDEVSAGVYKVTGREPRGRCFLRCVGIERLVAGRQVWLRVASFG